MGKPGNANSNLQPEGRAREMRGKVDYKRYEEPYARDSRVGAGEVREAQVGRGMNERK